MKRPLAITITSSFLVIIAIFTFLLPFILKHPELFSNGIILETVILLTASVLLYMGKKSSIILLTISALLFLGSGLYEAYSLNLPFSALRPVFYFSVALRLLFVIWVAHLLRKPVRLTYHSSGT